MKKLLKGLLLVIVLLALYLFLWPVEIDPVAWDAPEAPALEGVLAVNTRLAAVEVFDVDGAGPEDVAVDVNGLMYAGLDGGRIIRLNADGSGQETVADTGGRPLGLHFDSGGRLIVADAEKGLLAVGMDGRVEILTDKFEGQMFNLADDVDIGPDGTIYFSDASSRWDYHHSRQDIAEGRPYGALYAYHPDTGQTEQLATDLYFANGVAVSAGGDFVLVNETARYRVRRVWLTGPRAGEDEVVIDNLPGFPDGISRGSNGRFWIAIYAPRVGALDSMADKPWLRRLAMRLPEFMQLAPIRHGFVLAIDGDGQVLETLQHEGDESYSPITSVQEHEGVLYLGSLVYEGVGRLPLIQ